MKKILNRIMLKKLTAIFTTFIFIFTCVFGNNYAYASIGQVMPTINNINFDTPILPTSLGKITSAKYFDSEDIIINIQDLHCHAETQRKIASIIGYIDNTYNLKNVYLEGAFKNVDTSWLSAFNDNKNGTKVLEGLIDSGKLSGTEYYSIMNNKKNFVLGIEQEDLYKENIKLLGSILSLQPEIDAICAQMEKEISKIKRDYSSRQARKLEKLIKSFKQKDIDAKHYYSQLKLIADGFNLSMNKYPNIKIYMSLLENNHYVNNKKVIHEFTKFVSELKNILPYQQYTQLLKKSNNFNNLDDISADLIMLDKQYEITIKLKLENLRNFLTYLDFNQNINPIKLVQEEETFINELYVKAGRTKYEKEVSFLSDFVRTIRQYFTADISADEYYKFEKNYALFKTIWPSYFSENIIKNLDQYQKLLSKYHKNNITRDNIFADCLISKKNENNKTFINDTDAAIKHIKSNLNNKKIKLVVTGGFHTRGLERIFEQQKISYVIITPKITQPIEQAKQIYIDNVMYYSNILKNTINLEPLTQEPLNISFPKILNLIFLEVQKNSIFEEYSKQEIKEAIKQFVQEYIIAKQSGFYGQVEILNWDITSNDLTGKIEFFVEYKDNANKATVSTIKYQFIDGQTVPYSSIDVARTKQMVERIKNNKYAQPSVELEPTNATRRKIAKYVFEPLQKVMGSLVTLMPVEQLHMTIGYDSTPMTQQQLDSLAKEGDTSAEIFSVLDILGEDFVNFRTTMAGTLKLMPDGVIIYEITDKDLIERMLGFRTVLKSIDSKYRSPSIVHMTIGRISNADLLDGSEQSKQELAEILEKINETIYEINNKNALSKIKTTFTLKSGYVSSTGDKDFVFRRVLPKKGGLVVLQNLAIGSKAKASTINKVIVAPLLEEVIFRFIPFVVTGLVVSSPVSIVPVIVTGIIGVLGFSIAHPLADKINNYFYDKVQQGKIKSDVVSKLFNKRVDVRNFKDFLAPSVLLTAVFTGIAFSVPQLTVVALVTTSIIHSLNNLLPSGLFPELRIMNVDEQNLEKQVYMPEYIKLFKYFNLKTNLDLRKTDFVLLKAKEVTEVKDTPLTIADKFSALDRILENNSLALQALNKLNAESMKDCMFFVSEMISDFKIIAPIEASKAMDSLNNIERRFYNGETTVEELCKLTPWEQKGFENIDELHTLINALHQTSIRLFMNNIKYASNGGTKFVLEENGEQFFPFYNCLDSGNITYDMKMFLSSLNLYLKLCKESSHLNLYREIADINFYGKLNIEHNPDLIINGDKMIFSSKLGQHGIDALVDVNNGIRVVFDDSGRADGNSRRVSLLATLFSQAGFDIIDIDSEVSDKNQGICRFTALYTTQKGINTPENNALMFVKVLHLISELNDLDYSLEHGEAGEEEDAHFHTYSGSHNPKFTVEDFRTIKNTTQIPEKLQVEDPNIKRYCEGKPDYFKEKLDRSVIMTRKWKEKFYWLDKIVQAQKDYKQKQSQDFAAIYDSLGIDTSRKPWTILKRFVEGKILIKNGILRKNEEYDGRISLVDFVEKDVDESLKQAQIVNLLNYDELNFETEGHIGGMLFLSGILKLQDGQWLSIKVAVDRERRRAKFAIVELVDFDGNRRQLYSQELIKLLNEANYSVKEQNPRSKSEKEAALAVLRGNIPSHKDGIYMRGMGVSTTYGGYVPVKATYLRNKVDENSMWIVAYTTPDDVPVIMKTKGIMTTGGGMLSHAHITAREYGKTAVLTNGRWRDSQVELVHYINESQVETKTIGDQQYIMNKISENKVLLKEDDILLINGNTGRILMYDLIDKNDIEGIQKAIDENDGDTLKYYIKQYTQKNNESIKQLIEYIYFQTIWNKEKKSIINVLLSYEINTVVGAKLYELNREYTNEKLQTISEELRNQSKIKDPFVRMFILDRLSEEASTIRYFNEQKSKHRELDILKFSIEREKKYARQEAKNIINDVLMDFEYLLSKENKTDKNIDTLVKLSERAKVWNCYGNKKVKAFVAEVDALLLSIETSKQYDTEIQGFENIRAKDIVNYGGKTTELAKMSVVIDKKYSGEVKVPFGVGVSKNVLGIFFKKAGYEKEYKDLTERFETAIRSGDKETALELGKQIEELIDKANDDSLKAFLYQIIDPNKKYAVRSSGVGEDGGNHAFAGMADTKLNVSKEQIYNSIKECWKSFYSRTCIEDMIKENIIVKPALLIEEMVVDVEKAGVAFSRDKDGNVTLEIVLGLGEGLVSGRINPDHIVIRTLDNKIEYVRALDNMTKIVEKETGGTAIEKLSREEKIERIINEQTIRQLADVVLFLERDAGYPVDVEFAIDKDGHINVLQRRAITTFSSDETIDENEARTVTIFQILAKKLGTRLDSIYKIVVAPILEELVFRFVPFAVTGLLISSPFSIVPVIVTAIVGILGFSIAHPLADSINNYFYNKVIEGKLKSDFASKIFYRQLEIRNFRDFLLPSTLLTVAYIVISLLLPQFALVAPIITIGIHSFINAIAITDHDVPLLSVVNTNFKQENSDLNVFTSSLIKSMEKIFADENKYSYSMKDKYTELQTFAQKLRSIGEIDSEEKLKDLEKIVLEIFDYIVDLSKTNEDKYFRVNSLLVSIFKMSIYFNDNQTLFNRIFDLLEKETLSPKKSGNFQGILMTCGKYFYKIGKIEYVDRIINSLYKNKNKVKSMTDYGVFALPLPSPFGYDSIEDWELEITELMKKDDVFAHWYGSMIDMFLLDTYNNERSKYAYAIMRAMYKSGKQKTPPYINSREKCYEWIKEYNNACGLNSEYFNLEPSAVLLENKVYKEKITLSELISKLGYLKLQKEDNAYIQSPAFDSVIKTLTDASKLSSQEQLEVLKEQMKVLYTELFENKEIDSEILELFVPLLGVLNKDGKTTYLEDICNKLIEQGTKSRVEFGFKEMSYIYSFDKKKALMLIGKKFEETAHTASPLYEKVFGRNWMIWTPKTIKEARENIPEELQKVIYEYEDLEMFYNAIGISFDLMDEESAIFDRYVYEPEYQSLFDFVPNFTKNFKDSLRYFRILKEDNGRKLDISEQKELALDRILKNGNLALASISDSVEDLNKAISIIDKMLEDLRIISTESETIRNLEETLNDIKQKVKTGNIEEVLKMQTVWWIADKSIYALIADINNAAISKTKNISDKFEAFEKVLENNELALSSLTKLNDESVNDTIYFIEEMLDAFEIISPKIAQKAKISLLKIKKDIENGDVKIEELTKLNSWKEDSLDQIKELHTLINAVHQTSTTKLMTTVESSSENVGGRKVVLRKDGKDQIEFYDCSNGPIKDAMREFLVTLSEINKSSVGQWVIKDNKLIYSKQLGYHGVNILVDMEQGIRVTFNDSGRGDGNALRTTLLATLFAQAGFDITYVDTTVTESLSVGGPCKFTAVYNLQNDFNAPEKYAFLFSQALEILSNTRDVDYSLEDGNENENRHYYGTYYIPKLTVEDYRKMKNTFDMPEEFSKGKTGGLIGYWKGRIERVRQIREEFEKSKQEEKEELASLYDYLDMDADNVSPWKIAYDYVRGKLVINNGLLEQNSKYDAIQEMLLAINSNVDECLRQAQIVNLLDSNDLNFETEGYIGGMIALSGALRLDNEGWLSVKVAVDKERKRAKFAYIEYVDFYGNRRSLSSEEVVKILNDPQFNYGVKIQSARSKSEKKEALTVLEEKILLPKDGIYMRGMGISGQLDGYVPVRVTYDKEKVDENSMWVASFTSPEDVETIIKSKAIMTTTGGMLSHANITARENKKVAILSNGQWNAGQLEIPYYSIESDITPKMGYEIQKIAEHKVTLKEGDIVLVNGVNGRMLLYPHISQSDIGLLQDAINNDRANEIVDYLQNHSEDPYLREIIEYIFLQTVSYKTRNKINEYMLAWTLDTEIGKKVFELNKVYNSEKIKAIKQDIANESSIENEDIRYMILVRLEGELKTIRYSAEQTEEIDELAKLKKQVQKDKEQCIRAKYRKIASLTAEINAILSKDKFTKQDEDRLVDISTMAKVWYFYGSAEFKELIEKVDKAIVHQKDISYQTEIKDFEDIGSSDIFDYGAKTVECAKIKNLLDAQPMDKVVALDGIGIGKNVLKLFFEKAGRKGEYEQLIKELEKAIKVNDDKKAVSIGKQISKMISEIDDKDLKEFIESRLDADKKYAVRSSGVGEDGGNHAFAGMARTKLNVGKENVYESIKECWKSFYVESCIKDMVKEGLVVQPALLIQEMVSGVEKAGVLFTRDSSGNFTEETVLGLGEGLVSGRITPDHIVIRAHDNSINYRRALNNMIKIVANEKGGTNVAKLTREEKIERIVKEDTINKLKEMGLMLEKNAGYPVDIEFAIDKDGKVFVLQRRPITTLVQEETEETEDTSQEDSGHVIDQTFIDKAIEMISMLSMFDDVKGIVDKLSNLPEDVNEKYNVIIGQIKELVKFLKKNHKKDYNLQILLEDKYGRYYGEDSIYGKLRKFCLENNLIRSFDSNVYLSKVVIYILTSFLTLVDVNNSGNLLFYSIIDSLFTDEYGKDRDEKTVLSEMANIINITYSINPNFVPYIVNKLLDKNLISVDESAPYEIRSGLKDNYDAQKYYYFALSAKDKVNDNISENLLENVIKLRDIIPLIENETIKQDVDTIVRNLDELIDKVNNKNIVLLEMQLNLLLEKVKILKDTNKEVAFKIVDIILSICEQGVKENKDLNAVNLKIYDLLYPLLIDEFDNNTDHTLFNNVISKLNLLIQPQNNDKNIGEFKTFNAEVVKILLNVALHIYEPISSHELDYKNSEEYKQREQICLNIFRNLSVKRVTDTYIYSCLFNKNDRGISGIGFTPATLDILIDAAKRNNYILPIPSTTDDLIDENIELLANMVVDSIEYINPINMFTSSFYKELNEDSWFSSRMENKEKMKRFSCLAMEKLLSVAKDDNVDLAKRKRAVNILLETVSSGLYKNNIKDVPIDFEEVKLLAEKLNIPIFIYLGDASIKHGDGHVEYSFTPLLKFIPKSILEKFSLPLLDRKLKAGEEASTVLLRNKKPIITKISGKTNPSVAEVQQVLIRFSILQKIMEYNKSVLLLLDKLNDSKNYNKNLAELLNELQSMINELKKINIEHGNAAQEALDNIVIDLNDNTVDRKTKVRSHLLLSAWTKWEIKNIKEIHTLINAVHQISIADFKKEIGDISKIGAPIQVITAHQESTIEGYNLSDTINSNIIKFLSKLSTRKVPKSSINDFICKDDLVVWTTNLNQHSVDIFFNFGEADRGISIYYKEIPDHSYERGKKERVRYFKEILEYLGFYVEIDTEKYNGLDSYSIKATLNKDYGMNETMDLIDIATQVVEIFKYSSNIDCDFEARHYESSFEEVYKRWVTKAKRRESWYGVEISNQGKFYGYGNNGYKLDLLPEKRSLNAESLNDILSYLGCDLLPENVTREDLFDPIYLDKYFNKPIERAYVEGRIIFNEEGALVRNEEYDIVHSMINELNTNFIETSKQARIFNLVNTYEFNTRMLAYIGNFVVVSSVMELKNGDRLFIKAIMDPNTKRMKYAIGEKVTDLTRQKLSSDELIEILGKEGYVIPEQEWVMTRERKRIKNMLSRQVQTIQSPKIPSTPTSDGTGVSVVGNITFDKNNVDENSILIVPYTTPDDMRFIETAKGIITTGGGVLSHAAITTRELKKPSVVLNGATWTNNEIEILYYLASGEPETINNQFQVQKVKATRKTLKEGARVLINGETGAVLLFDDIDISLLDELQNYINSDNAQAVIDFMNNHSKDKNINRLVEYVYFQVVGNSKTTQTLDCLFSSDMPEIVQDKVKELNDSYIQDKVQSISEAIANLKTIANVNIAYMVLQELNKKLAFIKTVGTRSEIEELKEQLKYIEQEIKTKLNLYMQNFINDVVDLLSKDKLTSSEIQKMITMLKNIEIYNYFISDNETMNDLLSKKETLQILVPMLRDKVNGYNEQQQEIMLQNEISLFEERADNEKMFGSKTSQLAKMFKLLNGRKGVTVPGGIGISVNVMPMLFKSLGQENLLTEFENAIKNKDKQRAMEIAKEICKLIDSEELKGTELEKEIIKQLKKFIKSGQNYSVRSSGVGEDATNNAFAGMGETKLNIGYDDIYDNVRECWKSFFAERCIDYMISSGQVVKPAVLVEEMVDSEISGVVFSRDKYGNGRINALFGQGEGLVSGMFTPDSILFDMSSHEIIEYSVADKQFKLVTDSEGGIKKVAVGQNAKSRVLNAQNVKNLAEIIEILENSVGYPIDVEFAIRGNEIYILQMRPITTLDNKEKDTEITEDQIREALNDMQQIPSLETRHEIHVSVGKIDNKQDVFVYIANPLDPTQAIPVYKKSADANVTEFVVDAKYASLVKDGSLARALMLRINTDPVVLDKLNDGIFNYKLGEIGLLPILDEDELEKSLFDSTIDVGIENVRNILASA